MIDVSDIPGLLRRHAGWLIVIPALVIILALIFLMLKTPVYRTSAQLLVQPEGIQIIANDPNLSSGNQNLQGMDIDSQTYVILSEAVLNQVANQLDLDNDPAFRVQGIRTRLFGSTSAGSRSSLEIRSATLSELREIIQALRLDRSFVFLIRVSHPDPYLAAAIANETANAYIEQTRDSKTQALVSASAALGKQAEQLRSRVETAEAAVEKYRVSKGLITTSGGLVLDQQLEALNSQITDARVALERAKAIDDIVSGLTLADVEAGAIPQSAASSVLSSLRVQYSRIAQQEAEAATTLGASHPTLRELKSQLNNTQRQIRDELQRIKRAVRGEFDQAQSTLAALEAQSRSLQSQNSIQGTALIELRQLQSEAEASREVYEAFLKRARELEELPQIDTGTSRILSEAPVPTSPSGPRKIIVLAAAGLFGFVATASAIIGLAILNGNVTSERALVQGTGVPILASVQPAANKFGLNRLPRWLGGGRSSQMNEMAPTRIAYALRQALADRRPANVLVLTVGHTNGTTDFIRKIAEDLHEMGEAVLFAHANQLLGGDLEIISDGTTAHAGHARLGATISRLRSSEQSQFDTMAGSKLASGQAGYLSGHLRVEQIDPSRKYASSGTLDSSNEDLLLVDVGNPDTSPMLPVLLRHCDGIVLITALGEARRGDVERTIAYLEPWHDRIIGNVVFEAA